MAAPPPMAGFVTPMPPPMGQPMNMPMKHPSETPMEEEPANKKMRNEDSLIPEEVFLARNPVSLHSKLTVKLSNVHKIRHISFTEPSYYKSNNSAYA